jgi:predicted phage terminase large subunit-like protein
MEQEPGSSGVNTIVLYRRLLAGFEFHSNKTTGSKEIRANGSSSQAEGGNVKLVRGFWNDAFLNELAAFPMKGVHDDQVDAFDGAMEQIYLKRTPQYFLNQISGMTKARTPQLPGGITR